MSYFLANLGRRRTSSRNIECLAGATGLTGSPITMRFREVGQPWSYWHPYRPYFTIELSETLSTKTIEFEIDDTISTEQHTQEIELVNIDEEPSWYPETQRIANKLPQYHIGRRIRTSNWQRFMNGVGAAKTLITQDSARILNSQYIQTCPLDELTTVGVVYPDGDKLAAEKDPNANLLSNPILSLFRAPFLEPQDWALTGGWDVDTDVSLFGYQSLRCQPNVGERATAFQAVPTEIAPGETLTAGLYYQTSLPSSTTPLGAVDFSLVAVVLYEDGSSEIASAVLQPGTDTRWHLARLSIQTTQHTSKIFVGVVLEGQPTVSPFEIHIGGVQARVGSQLGSFSFGRTHPALLDNPTDNSLEPSKEMWFTSSLREFAYTVLPTRAGEPTAPEIGTFVAPPFVRPMFRLHTGHLDQASIGFGVSNDKIGMFVADPEELLREFVPAFYDQGAEGYIPMEGMIIEAVEPFANRLWAIGRFEDQAAADAIMSIFNWGDEPPVDGDNRMRYLLVLNHLTPAAPNEYLEVLSVYPLVSLDEGDPIVALEFENSDGRWVAYTTATERRRARLFYDYAIGRNDGSVWMREQEASLV